MYNVKVDEKNIAINVLKEKEARAGYIQSHVYVKIGSKYDTNTDTFSMPFNIEKAKISLSNAQNKIVDGTINSLSKKYSLAEEELLPATRKEYYAYIEDNTVATPTIDKWAFANGRTQEAEIEKIGIVLDFLEKSGLIQPILSKRIEETETVEDVQRVGGVLQELGGYRDKEDLINNYSRLIGTLNGGG